MAILWKGGEEQTPRPRMSLKKRLMALRAYFGLRHAHRCPVCAVEWTCEATSCRRASVLDDRCVWCAYPPLAPEQLVPELTEWVA